MNRNDKKQHRPNAKGVLNPNAIRDYKVYQDTTLLEFLYFKMPDTPKKNVKALLSHHQVAVGGVPVSQFNYPLTKEDVVTVSKYRIARKTRKDLPILYEDNDILALDKPSGLLSVATEREKGKTAYRLVSDYVTARDKKARIYVVHRLDEDTSGVLIFAKSQEVREALQHSWQEIVKKRGYYAIVEGEMEKSEDTLKDYLEQDNFQLVRVTRNKNKGKLAITVLVQRHERQRREEIIVGDQTLRLDAGIAQRVFQQPTERVRADLADERRLAAEFRHRCQKVSRCAARMCRHRGIAAVIGGLHRKVNQKLTQRYDIVHLFQPPSLICCLFLGSSRNAEGIYALLYF